LVAFLYFGFELVLLVMRGWVDVFGESLFAIVVVNVAVLANAGCVEFVMWAIPWFFGSSKFMIAVTAKSFGIVLFVLMPTFINFFTNYQNSYFFLCKFFPSSLHSSFCVFILFFS
jgi:hypothetical protein